MGGDERRENIRATVPLDGHWHGESGQRSTRIGDISTGGCFVESMASPGLGERVHISVTLPGGHLLEAAGEVAYVVMGMGFGVRFRDLTQTQQDLLAAAVQRLLGQP